MYAQHQFKCGLILIGHIGLFEYSNHIVATASRDQTCKKCLNHLHTSLDSQIFSFTHRSVCTMKCHKHYACDSPIVYIHISTPWYCLVWRFLLRCPVHTLAKFSPFDRHCMMPNVSRLHRKKCSTQSNRDHLMCPSMTNRCQLDLRCTILLCYRSWPRLRCQHVDAIRLFSHLADGHLERPHIRIHHRQSLPRSTPIYHDCTLPADDPTLTTIHFLLHFRVLPVLRCIQIHRIFYPKWLW